MTGEECCTMEPLRTFAVSPDELVTGREAHGCLSRKISRTGVNSSDVDPLLLPALDWISRGSVGEVFRPGKARGGFRPRAVSVEVGDATN